MIVRSTCRDSSVKNLGHQASPDDDFDFSPIVENVDDCLAGLDDDPERDARHARANASFLARLDSAVVALHEYRPRKVAALVSEWPKIVTTPSVMPLPKKVIRRKRRSDARDKQVIARTRISEIDAAILTSPPLAVISNTPLSTIIHTSNPYTSANENIEGLPAWEYCGSRLKLVLASRAVAGRSLEFTGNLGPDQLAASLASPKGFSVFMRLAIVRSLQRRLGPHEPVFWFGVDLTFDGRPHLHGIIADDNLRIAEIKEALLDALGEWGSKSHRNKQLQVRLPTMTPDGWVTYVLRNSGRVRKLIGGKGVVITHPMGALAKDFCQEQRSPLSTTKRRRS
ncbi:hypothetical protein FNL55_12290 [Tardiphaga sp. vice352]|uniref:hypothetical protein n=1 Tax=unclassified Tardiphaga TaxID=2631404 RepID=UPI0011655354|nr:MULTISPECIES: hypothetical protein [unclassified Tardiphaga]QDM16746.1 hypothetical protein FNL53_13005 [Tardiphaga sp. vice278]QDM32020.1 hypothetical protein FNL55_12290 [Tardiphaga sp. vice352]